MWSAMKHHHDKLDLSQIRFYIITVSTSKYRELLEKGSTNDISGGVIERIIREKGGKIVGKEIIDDDIHMIRSRIESLIIRDDIDIIVLTGGTGIAPRDVTIEAITPLLEKKLDGFGELFRLLTYQSRGEIAMLTRALAGTIRDKAVFALPGSPDAAELGIKLILSQATHIISLLRGL